jgi:hypothetical protein
MAEPEILSCSRALPAKPLSAALLAPFPAQPSDNIPLSAHWSAWPVLPAVPASFPGRLVVHKPDLPPSFGVQEGLAAGCAAGCPAGLSPRSSRYASVAALRSYPGPNAFAIPGNQ